VAERNLNKWMKFRANFKFGLNNRISLYERMSAFLEAGIPVFDALEAIRSRMEKRKDIRAKMFEEWLQVMRGGSRFSEALKDWVPSSEYMLISSGEQGGRLIDGLKKRLDYLRQQLKLRRQSLPEQPCLVYCFLCWVAWLLVLMFIWLLSSKIFCR
jgi:type II secretory pathway component PulF